MGIVGSAIFTSSGAENRTGPDYGMGGMSSLEFWWWTAAIAYGVIANTIGKKIVNK